MTQHLPFLMQGQLESEWCWAAVSASVAGYFNTAGPSGGPWQQCEIVNAELSQTTCCANGSASACNRDWYLDLALTRVGHLASPAYAGQAPFIPDVRDEVSANHPIGVRIEWYGGGTGHFVVIVGSDDTGGIQNVDIEDPHYGPSTYDYDAFVTAYQSGAGRWTHTYPIA